VYEVILQRKRERPEGSYVAKLFAGGHPAIAEKVCEEAAELAEAALVPDEDAIAHEAADLIFHALVLLGYRDVAPERVYAELERRFGTGGLVEKAGRTKEGERC
jgi:phosphoribosyl-ATP pyrophosphohydrolase